MPDAASQDTLIRQLQEWEAELLHRESALNRRETDIQQREQRMALHRQHYDRDLTGLEQRIRNARRRLNALTEEYERLRQKICTLNQTNLPPEQNSAPPDNVGCRTSNSEGSQLSGLSLWPPGLRQVWADPLGFLQKLIGQLLDRIVELQESLDRLSVLREQWLAEWNAALEQLQHRANALENWQRDLERRQAMLERAEAYLSQQAQNQRQHDLRLQAATARLAARERAWQLAIKQIQLRWRTAARAIRQRELHLQWLYEEWQARLQSAYRHWQESHHHVYELARRYAHLSRHHQVRLAELEQARFRLWEKQQALEAAIQTWTVQTQDATAAETHLRACQQRLTEHLAAWERRLHLRERQLAAEWDALSRLLAHLCQRERDLQVTSHRLCFDTLACQWQVYCRWIETQRESAKSQIVQIERDYLRDTNRALLEDIENLVISLLRPLSHSESLPRAA